MSWPLVKLGDIFKITSGGTPSRKKKEYYEGGTIHWVKTGDLHHKYVESASEFITQEGLDGSSTRLYPEGTVLLAMYGATIGACSILNVEACTNQACAAFTPNEKIDLEYFYYLMKDCKSDFVKAGSGGAQPNISASFLKEFEIPLPPLDEQKRLAAILDKADAIRRKRQQAIKLADDFLRSVFLDMFGDPVTNPKGWEVRNLKDIARIQIGPFGTQLHKEDYMENGIPLINPTHIVKGEIIPKTNLTISDEKHASLSEYHLKTGDIVMGRRGEMGRCAIVSGKEDGWMCGTGSLFIRPKQTGVFSEYLNKLLSSQAIKNHLESESQGATMPNLNKTIVGNIKIPVPTDEVLEQFTVIKETFLKTKTSAIDSLNEPLFESLSQKAFASKL
ncbi:restriction endonuclease subunit S [Pseudoalteromonas sp. SR45-4]|uniref:restriction endonuclease subunit S n=1 Tax=Pseudoalteromonas sp. SR45-4 TaxID=2760929 RepID=UPI002873DD32|nr:restriction endonuclease subunit S [Pseudoalteromonas sp. SR45-4]